MLRVEASGAADPEDPPHRAPRGALLTPPEPSTAPARKSGGASFGSPRWCIGPRESNTAIEACPRPASGRRSGRPGAGDPTSACMPLDLPPGSASGRRSDGSLRRQRVARPRRHPRRRHRSVLTSARGGSPSHSARPRRALGDRLPGPVPLRRSEGSARPGRLVAVTGAWPSVPERRPGEKPPRVAARRRTRPPRYGVSRETGPRASSAWRSWRRPRGPVKGPRPRRNPVSTVPDAFACRGEACASPSAFAIRKASIRQDFCE